MKFTGKTISDEKPLNELLKRLTKLENTSVEYGYDATPHHSGKTLAEIAAIHEYGMYGNPERDFMHQTFINLSLFESPKILKNAEEYMYYGGNIMSVYANIGKMAISMITDTISAGNFTENAPMTIALKGSNKPLIETGQLQHGAKYWVVKEKV